MPDDMNAQLEEPKTPLSEENPPFDPPIGNLQNPPLTTGLHASNNDSYALNALLQQNADLIKSMSNLMQSLSFERKPRVIPPGKFKLGAGETLIQFLMRFENYCDAMYPGSTEGRVSLLGTFLEGLALEVYKIITCTSLEYEEVKRLLLQWYREELEKEIRCDAQNFTDATIKPGETIPLFALRLAGLASRAFPENDVTKMPIVRQKFLKSLPQEVKSKVDNTLMAIETSLGVQIPWERLVAIVESSFLKDVPNDESSTKARIEDLTKSVPVSALTGEVTPRICCCQQSAGRVEGCSAKVRTSIPTISEQQSPQPFQRERPSQQVSTPYPNRERPGKASTWCRGQTNRPFQTNQRQSCAHCKKPGHLMSQCWARPLCRYCGKRGHQYDDCYLGQNRCLHCKEVGHLVGSCPIKNNDQIKCPMCEGDHLGKDCTRSQGNC